MMQATPIPSQPTPTVVQESVKASELDVVAPVEAKDEVIVEEKPALPLTPTAEGLSALATVDRLFITRRLHVRSAMMLRGKKNRFLVHTPDHLLLYTIEEENSWWVGYLFYGLRPMVLHVYEGGREVLRLVRPWACTMRVFPCYLQRLQVYRPDDTLLGSVEQQWTVFRPLYRVRDKHGNDAFWIKGPRFTLSCFWDVQFAISGADGSPVGATCRRWQGLRHALFTAPVSDRFGVAWERDLDPEHKALLLGAALLIEYMYYDV